QAEPALPPVHALVNPNRLDDESGLGQLAAVGVTFLFVVALNRALRQRGFFETREEPPLLEWLDLVALGTVCDVVPLTGVNRAFVRQGLAVMARRGNAGLSALAHVADIDEPPTTYHAGFVFGPRINAGGRVGRSELGAQLLSTEDPAHAQTLAQELDLYNSERRAIETQVLDEAQEMAARQVAERPQAAAIIVAAKGWHPGVIGIVASRLKDRFHLPAIVIALESEGEGGGTGKGSGRSVAGLDLGAAVTAAKQAGLLINGGGHKMAAGLTVATDKLPDLVSFLESRITEQSRDRPIARGIGIDAVLG
ncbi:MAG TPA: single-stranded-DNA-specific exonuclease RecJ, partial [Alphaproteobacteria bacterium]|nr:single-stranded-DNA-specific exonuclease RecJ [Alphaproteobacteria bacterium]